MRYEIDLDCDEETEEHIWQRHQVTVAEVEAVFYGPDRPRHDGEVWYLAGQTRAGRYLLLVYLMRGTEYAKLITARELDVDEKSAFKRARKPSR